ncbi:MAG: PIN domain-containing protein [Nanoarchaeota archaeon]|nr:PIN domain-containing protein [Nanoarchaeota archaeon]
MKYYLDTCIWRDYFEDRKDRFRSLGEWALMLINKIIKEKGVFIISEHVLYELGKEYDEKQIYCIFKNIREHGAILSGFASKSQREEAYSLSREMELCFNDALHAVLARDNGAILVTSTLTHKL